MRPRLIVVVAMAAMLAVVSACGAPSTSSSPARYPERSTTIATVEVKAQPIQLDSGGAAFTVSLDTHSGSLEADLAATARLEVNGTV
jgi:hypothetical protein